MKIASRLLYPGLCLYEPEFEFEVNLYKRESKLAFSVNQVLKNFSLNQNEF